LTALGRGFRGDAAIYLNTEVKTAMGSCFGHSTNRFERTWNKGLAPKTWEDGHAKNEIDRFKVGQDGRGLTVRVKGNTRGDAEFTNAGERAGDIMIGFGVHRDAVGSGFSKSFEVAIRMQEHQVRIKEEA
jgi:hypothetical protein